MIFAWLLARPAILVGAGALILAGTMWTQDYFEDRTFRTEIARLQQELRREVQANAGLRLAVSASETSIETLKSTIVARNAEIDIMGAEARQAASAANLRVARAIRDGEAKAAALRSTTTRVPPGHDEMNEWLRERLGVFQP